jgi:hypothetical protein
VWDAVALLSLLGLTLVVRAPCQRVGGQRAPQVRGGGSECLDLSGGGRKVECWLDQRGTFNPILPPAHQRQP